MLKKIGKKIIVGLMIVLMAMGVFFSVANFIQTPVWADDNGWDGALVYIFGENRYDCATDWKIDCIIVTP